MNTALKIVGLIALLTVTALCGRNVWTSFHPSNQAVASQKAAAVQDPADLKKEIAGMVSSGLAELTKKFDERQQKADEAEAKKIQAEKDRLQEESAKAELARKDEAIKALNEQNLAIERKLGELLAQKAAPAPAPVILAPTPNIVGGNPLGIPLTNAVTARGPSSRSFDIASTDDTSIVNGLTRLSTQTKDPVAVAALKKAAVAVQGGARLPMDVVNILKAISLGMTKVGFSKDAAIVAAATEAVHP